MATTAPTLTTATTVPVIPLGEMLPWVTFAAVVGMLLMYFVGAEQGATSVLGGTMVHEFVHDARHLLGFPCH